ncbi:MAG: ribosome-associated translation inhibitor RaiA [Verrucomicrobiae bacterium]|nr:ribosome-associated translation inhibitor RaiA [Verrucomicrobiae bacterium]
MQIHISPRDIRLTSAIRDYITQRIENLENLEPRMIGAHIAFCHAERRGLHHRFLVKAHLALPGPDLHAEARGRDLYALIDAVADKLSMELRRRKGRFLSRRREDIRRLKQQRRRGAEG